MAHRRARLTVFGRQLLVARVGGWLAGGARRRAARGQPGDGVQVGPPLSGRGRCRSRRPLVPAASLAAPAGRGAPRPQILAAGSTWRYGPDRLGPLLGRPPSTVHRRPRPAWARADCAMPTG